MQRKINTGKRILFMVALIFGICILLPKNTYAEVIEYQEGYYTYQVIKDKAYIVKYDGMEEVMKIPSTLGGYPVEAIMTRDTRPIFKQNYVTKKMIIPESVTGVLATSISGAYELEEIVKLGGDFSGLYTRDGVLYYKDGLLKYPPAKKDTYFVIPRDIVQVVGEAFECCKYLKKLVFPEIMKWIGPGAVGFSKIPMDVVFRCNNTSCLGNLFYPFYEMPKGSRVLVKNQEVKQEMDEQLEHLPEIENGKLTVEIETLPATALTYPDGSTEKSITVDNNSYFDFRDVPWIHTPADTSDAITWTSEDPRICEVYCDNSYFTARKAGRVQLTGRDDQGHELKLFVHVQEPFTQFDLYEEYSLDIDSKPENNLIRAKIAPTTCCAYQEGITWSIENPEIAKIHGAYKGDVWLQPCRVGKTKLIAQVENAGELVTKTIDIYVKDIIENAELAPCDDQIYTGEEITPPVKVTYKGHPLTEGVDYKLKYINNKEVGTALINVYGCGEYFFDVAHHYQQTSFRIVRPESQTTNQVTEDPGKKDGETSQNTCSDGDSEDNAFRCTASYKKAYGSKPFYIEAKNITGKITYSSSNKQVATVSSSGKVKIRNTGYTKITLKCDNQTAVCKIYVVPEKTKINKVKAKGKTSITTSWNRDSRADGYEIQLASNKAFTRNKKSIQVTTKSKNKKLSKVTDKQKSTYTYVRIRSYKTIEKKKYFGAWSKTIKYKNS